MKTAHTGAVQSTFVDYFFSNCTLCIVVVLFLPIICLLNLEYLFVFCLYYKQDPKPRYPKQLQCFGWGLLSDCLPLMMDVAEVSFRVRGTESSSSSKELFNVMSHQSNLQRRTTELIKSAKVDVLSALLFPNHSALLFSPFLWKIALGSLSERLWDSCSLVWGKKNIIKLFLIINICVDSSYFR